MDVEIIQTGSSGNCVILDKLIALDMGVAFKRIKPVMLPLKLVFISHRHGDHFCDTTVWRLAQNRPSLRFCCGEFMASSMVTAGVKPRNIDILYPGKVFDYGFCKVEAFELFHDVPNYGLKISRHGQKAVYIVDTGHLDGIEAKGFDYYLVEANHNQADIEERAKEKLDSGQYAYEIRAAENHLSFEQAADWLAENMGRNSVWFPLHAHEKRREEWTHTNI